MDEILNTHVFSYYLYIKAVQHLLLIESCHKSIAMLNWLIKDAYAGSIMPQVKYNVKVFDKMFTGVLILELNCEFKRLMMYLPGY